MSFLDILFPPRCIHCRKYLEQQGRFCQQCLSHFTLLPKEGHCIKCAAQISTVTGVCIACRTGGHPLKRFAACFDAYGPARSLLHLFFQTRHPELIREIASLLLIQLSAVDYPSFDAIIMVPCVFFNAHYAIGRDLARRLEIPFVPALRRACRQEVDYTLKSRCNLMDKQLLLLQLETSSRHHLRKSAEALAEGWPRALYGLTFCATC